MPSSACVCGSGKTTSRLTVSVLAGTSFLYEPRDHISVLEYKDVSLVRIFHLYSIFFDSRDYTNFNIKTRLVFDSSINIDFLSLVIASKYLLRRAKVPCRCITA